MTRILSELLGAKEPAFRLGITRLERANGMPSTDIRLSGSVTASARAKLQDLGLDPHDTTGPELYETLKARLHNDEQRLVKTLEPKGHDAADPTEITLQAVKKLQLNPECFVMKTTVARRLLKVSPPKRTMKLLGYRSLDSMLKHESVGLLIAAASLAESAQWNKRLLASYQKLRSSDFETRKLSFEHPVSKRWQDAAAHIMSTEKHHVFAVKELGTIILLPLPENRPKLATLTTVLLTLHAIHDVQLSSTYLKFHQVRPDFGVLVEKMVLGDTSFSDFGLNQNVPWHIIQRYCVQSYEKLQHLFEPHIQLRELQWQTVEDMLARLEPSLVFWQHTAHLGILHDHKPVSLNITDALLSHSNRLPFESRLTHFLKTSLWHELMLGYMSEARVEQAVLGQLEPTLATELVTI
jgi:hypothetical protein